MPSFAMKSLLNVHGNSTIIALTESLLEIVDFVVAFECQMSA